MDAITGGLGEDNLGKFFKGMGVAAKEIKDPNTLVKAAIGVKALGEAMQSFKGIDGDQINTALEAVVEAGGSDKAIQIFTGSAQAAGAGGGGDTFVTNNYYNDNSVKSAQRTDIKASPQTRQTDGTYNALVKAGGVGG